MRKRIDCDYDNEDDNDHEEDRKLQAMGAD